jgi:ribosomal protein S20
MITITKKTTKEIANNTKADAREFFDKMEEIFEKL